MKDKKKERRFMRLKEFWRRLKKSKMAMFGLVILSLLVAIAIFASVIAPYSYSEQHLENKNMKPNAEHIFGCDDLGRDIFTRVIYGSRISLSVGFIAVGIAVVFGGLLGAVAGYFGGVTDNIIMRSMDILLAVPQILLAISISAALGTGLVNLMIAVGISSIPQYARIMRASVLTVKDQEYIEATHAAGATHLHTIIRHIIPNCFAPIIVQATLGVAFAILTAAGLSFIGLGLDPEVPEWGAMLAGGRQYIRDFPHITFFPGLAIMITIFALNVLGDGFRDALDPKLRD